MGQRQESVNWAFKFMLTKKTERIVAFKCVENDLCDLIVAQKDKALLKDPMSHHLYQALCNERQTSTETQT